jgi:hypothetical protein
MHRVSGTVKLLFLIPSLLLSAAVPGASAQGATVDSRSRARFLLQLIRGGKLLACVPDQWHS